MTAAIERDRAAGAKVIRRRVSHPHVWELERERPFLDALILLGHIREDTPPDTVKWAHSELVREARRRLQESGYMDEWIAPLLFDVIVFLASCGWQWTDDRWQFVGFADWHPHWVNIPAVSE